MRLRRPGRSGRADRPASLRLRLAATVGLVTLVVLAAAGAGMVWAVGRWMHDTVRSEAVQGLEAARIELLSGVPAESVRAPVPGRPTILLDVAEFGDATKLDNPASEQGRPAVVDGSVTNLGEWRALPLGDDPDELAPGETMVRRFQLGGHVGYLAMTSVTDPSGRTFSLASVAPLTETERTITALRTATVASVPALALLLAGLAALITGRTLRPVRVMRTEADAISHGTLHQRLTPQAGSAELSELAGTMNDMLDRLDRSAARQRRFTADASHELRSPLATVRGTIELALTDPGSLQESGPVALGEIDRLDHLVTDLLVLSRLDADTSPSVGGHDDVDLDDVVREQVAALNGTTLAIDTSAVEHVRLQGDRRALVSVVRNLLDNALNHASTAVSVTLRSDPDGIIHLIVDDDGVGIPEADRERVFERFARLDDARTRDTGGTGLGLAVSSAIVTAHGGTITATDSPTGGARLHVTLPDA